jgi:GNAT superfamily N-acetyltransferase
MTVTRTEIHPATPERWADLVDLFGERGAYDGCWCMFWRLSAKEYSNGRYAGNRALFRERVCAGGCAPPGVLAYIDGSPAGWCSLGPREEYGRLQRSRVLGPVDERPVWSIVCFYVHRGRRRNGLARTLLAGAVEFARERGAGMLEAYPLDPSHRVPSSNEAYTGVLPMFREAGFQVVARRGATKRPVVRLALD